MVWLHILAGTAGLVSGLAAMIVRKGSRAHAAAGIGFVASMSVMAISGVVLAFLDQDPRSVVPGLFTFYLVVTAWLAVRTPWRWNRLALGASALLVFAVGAYAFLLARPAAGEAVSVNAYHFFGLICVAAGSSDLRQLAFGLASGRQRLVRHLWRMLMALVLACAAFFLGQADEFPAYLQNFALLAVPVIVPLLAIPYWLLRIRRKGWAGPRPSLAGI